MLYIAFGLNIMNFSIYIRDELGKKLEKLAKQENVSRNNLITEAVENLIERRETGSWGDEVLSWQGCPEFELSNDKELTPPQESIF